MRPGHTPFAGDVVRTGKEVWIKDAHSAKQHKNLISGRFGGDKPVSSMLCLPFHQSGQVVGVVQVVNNVSSKGGSKSFGQVCPWVHAGVQARVRENKGQASTKATTQSRPRRADAA